MKFRIREKSIELETETRRQRRKEEKELNKRLTSLMEDRDSGQVVSEEELASVRRELQELELARAQKIIFRARANYARYGEKSSSYFLNLEKRKTKGRIISSLITDVGNSLTDTKDILEYERAFYEKLYEQEEDVPEIPVHPPCNDFPQISEPLRVRMERELTAQELRTALKEMNRGKCPGSDGLTIEF